MADTLTPSAPDDSDVAPPPAGGSAAPASSACLPASAVELVYGPSANPARVSLATSQALREILGSIGQPSAAITGTVRDAAEQAEAMARGVEAKGVDAWRGIYTIEGNRVLDVWVSSEGKDRAARVAAMAAQIDKEGRDKVSLHCADPKKLQVVDLALSSLSDPAAARAAFQSDSRISKVILEKSALHLEVPQKAPAVKGRPVSPFFLYAIGQVETRWGLSTVDTPGEGIPRWVSEAQLSNPAYAKQSGRKILPFSCVLKPIDSSGTSPALTVSGYLKPGLKEAASVEIKVVKGGKPGTAQVAIRVNGGKFGSELTVGTAPPKGGKDKKGKQKAKPVICKIPLVGAAAGFFVTLPTEDASTYKEGDTWSFEACTGDELKTARYPEDVSAARAAYSGDTPAPLYNRYNPRKKESSKAKHLGVLFEVEAPTIPCASLSNPKPAFGYGLFQLDAASNWDWLTSHDWADPLTIMDKACEHILADKKVLLQAVPDLKGKRLLEAVACAYNAGTSKVKDLLLAKPDSTLAQLDLATYGHDYGKKVFEGLAELLAEYKPPAGEPVPSAADESTLFLKSEAAKKAMRDALTALKTKSKRNAIKYVDVLLAVTSPPEVA